MCIENGSPSTRRRVSSVVTNVFPSQKTEEACDTGATALPVRESGTATPPLPSALQWLGLQLNLQPATPLRRGRRLAIFIPTDHLLDMPAMTAIPGNLFAAVAA